MKHDIAEENVYITNIILNIFKGYETQTCNKKQNLRKKKKKKKPHKCTEQYIV